MYVEPTRRDAARAAIHAGPRRPGSLGSMGAIGTRTDGSRHRRGSHPARQHAYDAFALGAAMSYADTFAYARTELDRAIANAEQ